MLNNKVFSFHTEFRESQAIRVVSQSVLRKGKQRRLVYKLIYQLPHGRQLPLLYELEHLQKPQKRSLVCACHCWNEGIFIKIPTCSPADSILCTQAKRSWIVMNTMPAKIILKKSCSLLILFCSSQRSCMIWEQETKDEWSCKDRRLLKFLQVAKPLKDMGSRIMADKQSCGCHLRRSRRVSPMWSAWNAWSMYLGELVLVARTHS